MIRTLLVWGAVIAVLAIIITNPAEAANFVMTVVGGIVNFFKYLANGFMDLFN